ncbi:MAG: hypothetical protein LUM44_21435 [Pyrinomonadaceae bacterium]|nr:hypothetical protein [Pyrinomonadaceae bacterium]
MKNITILSLSALFLIGCGNANQQTANTSAQNAVNNSTVAATKPAMNDSGLVSSHSTEKSAPPKTESDKTSVGSPNQQAVDVSEMTAKIEKADKEYKAKTTDAKAKETLAAAYFERAFALTKAAQYRAALGDFRKGLKLNPNDTEAKAMHDQIISIFESIGREPPKEGEEPPPMPIKK